MHNLVPYCQFQPPYLYIRLDMVIDYKSRHDWYVNKKTNLEAFYMYEEIEGVVLTMDDKHNK